MSILKHLFLTHRKQPMQKSGLQQLLDMFLEETERQSIFTTFTNTKTAQESVKSLMAVNIIPYQKRQILAPKRK